MRKLAFVFALLILAISVNTALALPGSGIEEDPWRIESLADFNEFATDPNYWDGHTRLEMDVNLAGQTYSTAVIAPDTNSSRHWFQGTAFTGVFDGNNHKITGLTIDDEGAGNWYLGLFGFIDGGQVSNLGLEGGSVSGNRIVGGLVGGNYGIISNCYSTGDVSGDYAVGGLVGEHYRGSISNCYSTGDVSGDDRVGGLVGGNYYYGSISNCYSRGDVSGDRFVGGLMGFNSGSVSNCYSTGDVSGDVDYVGGLVGLNDYGGSVSNCYSTGSVSGDEDVGGLVGGNYGIISNCYSTGSASGDRFVGGLVGFNSGSVSNCYSRGDANGYWNIGGFVGENRGIISNCYSTGSASGDYRVGGLVGEKYRGSISNCYSTGSVSGGWDVGGLVGRNRFGSVSNCYSSGDVSGDKYVGGLVGENGSYASVSNCFWDTDTQTHGVTESIGRNDGTVTNAEGLPTAEMQDINTYLNAGWDFVGETANGTDDIWLICQGHDYPRLWWQYPAPVLEAEPEETILTSNLISWSEVSDANAYWAECAEDANFQYVVDSSGWISQTSYVFFGLETGVTYWYRVKAGYYCDIESRWSNVESSTQVQFADAVLALLAPSDVKNENMLLSLANKLDATQGMMDNGQYNAAISKLENDILQKTDGCAETGSPDENDWITTCEIQELIYPLIIETIELLSDE